MSNGAREGPVVRSPQVVAAGLASTVIDMGGVYGVEKVIGNSLSCGLWAECPTGAIPGIHLGGGNATGASPTINFGRAKTNTPAPQNGTQNPLRQQTPDSLQQQGTTPQP